MQIKTKRRYHLTPVRLAIIKKKKKKRQELKKADEDVEKRAPHTPLEEMVQPLWKTV